MKQTIAKVAVELSATYFDKPYSYIVPAELCKYALPGCRVTVPFGGGNRKKPGLILELSSDTEIEKLKPILSVLDKAPLLSNEMLELVYWLKDNTFCGLYDAVRTMLPAGINVRMVVSYRIADGITEDNLKGLDDKSYFIAKMLLNCLTAVEKERLLELAELPADSELPEKLVKKGIIIRTDNAVRRIGDAAIKMARLNIPYEKAMEREPTPKQKSVLKVLNEAGAASVKELCYFTGVGSGVVNTLAKKGILELFENEVYRKTDERTFTADNSEIILTEEQQAAYNSLLSLYEKGEGGVSLLYGITGSGKTSVFMKLIDRAVEDNKGVIVMVPEISLTPQTLQRFRSRYGDKIAVFHSALSIGQRLDEWKRIKNGDAVIAIGTRSAVFAPFENLGLIIMDEEQEHTYKSGASPRFHARDVSKFRCAYNKCPLVLASATPSVESFYMAEKGKYSVNRLENRYGGAVLPSVEVVDMKEEIKKGNTDLIGSQLCEAIEENLNNSLQSILLMNRRGYNTFVSCRDCGGVVTCPHCSISMTYHSANSRLMCHYCGYSVPMGYTCSHCGSDNLRYAGQGTQMTEEQLERLFPGAKILRMDSDSTMTKNSYEKKLDAFARGNYDIMLGTQMVAKGLDFPRVALVGIVNADQMLYSDDFRSYERAFSLLTQVVGRAGRGETPGRAIIQTTTPENEIIELASRQDYDRFYNSEILVRKAMLYPPFADICLITFVSANENKAQSAAYEFFEAITYRLKTEYSDLPVRILGPSSAFVAKVGGKYRFKLIIKCKNTKRFRSLIAMLLTKCGQDKAFKEVSVLADMNPESAG